MVVIMMQKTFLNLQQSWLWKKKARVEQNTRVLMSLTIGLQWAKKIGRHGRDIHTRLQTKTVIGISYVGQFIYDVKRKKAMDLVYHFLSREYGIENLTSKIH